MDNLKKHPWYPVLEALEEAFSPRPIIPGTSIDIIMFEAGQRRVIGFLRDRIEQEVEDALNGKG